MSASRHPRLTATIMVTAMVLTGCDTDRRAISRDDLPAIAPEPAAEIVVDRTGFDATSISLTTDDHIRFVFDAPARLQVDFGVVDDVAAGPLAEVDLDTGLAQTGESLLLSFDTPGRHLVVVADPDGSPGPGGAGEALVVEASATP